MTTRSPEGPGNTSVDRHPVERALEDPTKLPPEEHQFDRIMEENRRLKRASRRNRFVAWVTGGALTLAGAGYAVTEMLSDDKTQEAPAVPGDEVNSEPDTDGSLGLEETPGTSPTDIPSSEEGEPLVVDTPETDPIAESPEITPPASLEFNPEVTALGIAIPEHIQEVRNQAVEMCTTSRGDRGGRQMSEDWERYGYDRDTGMDWPTAFTFMADGSWYGSEVHFDQTAENTYRNINDIAENCQEAAFLAASGAGIVPYISSYLVTQVRPALEELRSVPYDPTTTIMNQFKYTINVSYDEGYITRPVSQ